MRKNRQHTVASSEERGLRGKFILFLFFSLVAHYSYLSPIQAELNNTIAYSVSHTSSTTANDLNTVANATIAQTVYLHANDTVYGVVVYLDRQGFSSSTDSVKLRWRPTINEFSCNVPDTSQSPKIDVYVKVTDIPDGDATRNTLPPDSVARGYAIWFIFSEPVIVSSDLCYNFFLNAPRINSSNRINWFYGTNGYAEGSAWYQTTGSWTNYNSDMDFRIIKDKYALLALRRLPFNLKGAITINSDIDSTSVVYLDSLHRWLNTSQNVGGGWGQGLGGNIAGNDLWFGRSSGSDSTGKYSSEVPYYFHDKDTLLAQRKDSVDAYISRRWTDGLHAFGDGGWSGTADPWWCDSSLAKKYIEYMLARSPDFGKLYKGGIWVNHSDQRINLWIGSADTSHVGDSSGTVYYHIHRTGSAGRFKFFWVGDLVDPETSSTQKLGYTNWLSLCDSLNFKETPFSNRTWRDNSKSYIYARIGRSTAANPDSLYEFFNLNVARQCVDSNWFSIVYTHLAMKCGLSGKVSRDSIKAVHDSASSWGLWIPSTKALLNQQAASAFAQITVDRPSGSKRRVNIKSMNDWSWGSRVPDKEELYYLTFIAYAPESLIVTLNASETLSCSTMTSQQDVATNYYDPGSGISRNRAMSWTSMYNRTAGRKIIIPSVEAPPAEGQRRRTAVIEQLLSKQ